MAPAAPFQQGPSVRKTLAAALPILLLDGAGIAGVLDLTRKPPRGPEDARLIEARQALQQDIERLDSVARQIAARSQQAVPAEADGIQVLAHGPIHKAFAEPTNRLLAPARMVPKPPPEPIAEVPKDDKPAGAQWIPSFWAWDDDQGDYVWVSGCWRVPPPDRRWEAPHRDEANQGWEWVPDYWASANQDNVQHLPAPRAAPEDADEPATPAPDDNCTHYPGCWIYVEAHYVWQSGRWIHNPWGRQ